MDQIQCECKCKIYSDTLEVLDIIDNVMTLRNEYYCIDCNKEYIQVDKEDLNDSAIQNTYYDLIEQYQNNK